MSILLAMAAEFVAVVRNDPITLEKQAAFITVDESEHTFGLTCRPGKAEIDIVFMPRGYFTADHINAAFWSARADSRFEGWSKPENNAWFFGDTRMTYGGANTNLWNLTGATAKFIDQLAKDKLFNIRWEATPERIQTAQISYSIDVEQLRRFISDCGPKRVIAKLKEMGSPAAP